MLNYKTTEMIFAEFYVDWADTCNYVKTIFIQIRQKRFGLLSHVNIQQKIWSLFQST